MDVFFFLLCAGRIERHDASDEEGAATGVTDPGDLAEVGQHSFAHMTGDQDSRRLEVLRGRTKEETAEMEKQRM